MPPEAASFRAMPGTPDQSERHETLRGGERVLIRPARPGDVALYRDFVGHVDAEDLRLRFFAHIAEYEEAEAEKLKHLDYRHDMAFVALDEATGEMLGLVRLKDELDEETAEYAILVRSRLKGHGLGWLRQGQAAAPRLWRRARRKHLDAANVRRARLPCRGYRFRHEARRAQSEITEERSVDELVALR
jgi:hypothetical protein